MEERLCRRCQKKITEYNPRLHGYCSYRCKETKEHICAVCGRLYEGTGKTCSNECKTKLREQTNLERYGTTNVSKSDLIKEKRKKTNLEKYGVEFIGQSEEKREKRKQTSLEKYGVDNPSKAESVKEKAKETNLNRYGVEYSSQLEKTRQNKSTIMKEMWQDEKFRENYKQTIQDLYGVDSLLASKEIIEKREQNNLEKYGVSNTFERVDIKEKIKEKIKGKYGVTNPMKSKEIVDRVISTNMKKYGVPFHCMTEECRSSQGKTLSKVNKDIAEYINVSEFKFPLDRYSYDLKKENTLIEIDPTYTHNATTAPYFRGHQGNTISKTYHQDKTLRAIENGYKCIHIFDWDDLDKIRAMLQDKETLYARNLDIREVPLDLCDQFLNENHLQGTCKGQIIRLGLYRDNSLAELMTFGKPRYNKNYEYELLRLCTLNTYKIVGGAEKLFKHFLSSYGPSSVISYCDNSKFSGDVYKRLGFTLKSFGTPSCHWYNIKTGRHITDNLLRQGGFSQLHGDNKYEKASRGASNRDLMIEEGYVEVYDCGQSIYVWK